MSGVRAIVFRDTYRGRIVWGATRWTHRGGVRVRQVRPESEWVVRDVAALRIVSEDLWQAAHDRLDRTRQTYLRSMTGRVLGRPESGIESTYLLAGFVQCAECGGGMHVARRCYLCTNHRTRGRTACANALGAPLEPLHAEVLERLERDVLTPDVVEAALVRAVELWTDGGDAAGKRERLEREAARLEAEIARYTEAVGVAGAPIAALVDALKTRQRRLIDVRADLRGP